MNLLHTLLTDLPANWRVNDIYVGVNWVLSIVQRPDGMQQAGVAATPHNIAPDARFQPGHYVIDEDAADFARLLASPDMTAAAVGLATINALNQPDETQLTTDDAADWLAAQSRNRSIAIFGRFPFIDAEIRPHARQVWVFEQQPQGDELDSSAIQTVLPQADLVAITGSAIINHTIDLTLPFTRPDSIKVVLGPSTPLSTKLLDHGITAIFGVRVIDLPAVIESVREGEGFQKMRGLQRIALFKAPV